MAFLDNRLPTAIDEVAPPSVSWLSLLSQREQLEEWLTAFDAAAPGTEYEALSFVGMFAHPIAVTRCAATQMNPYQMRVTRVWPSQIDTASLLCALKCGDVLRAPEGGEPQDILPLID